MPTPVKAVENMEKHMTQEELDARKAAEAATIPDRSGVLKLRKPAFVAGNKTANKYWNGIMKSMEGLVLLDDLDSEMLAGYCSMLARRDEYIVLSHQLMRSLGVSAAIDVKSKKAKKPEDRTDAEFEQSACGDAQLTPDQILEAVSKLDSLTGKLQAMERNLLTYADKLGLTPSGRVRLAQKRAESAAAALEPDGDLFGD